MQYDKSFGNTKEISYQFAYDRYLKHYKREYNELDWSNISKLEIFDHAILHLGALLNKRELILYKIKVLITQPEIISLKELHDIVNSFNQDGYTPLHIAVQEAHLGCVKVLVRYGADISLLSLRSKQSAIDIVRRSKNQSKDRKDIFIYLRSSQLELDTKQYISEQLEVRLEMLCLQRIADKEHIQEIHDLINKEHINVNNQDPLGDTPLHLSCMSSNELRVMNLIALKADICSNKNIKGRSVLHYACQRTLDLRVYLAIKYPFLLLLRDNCGKLPMHIAAKKNDAEFIKFIFEKKLQLQDSINCKFTDENIRHDSPIRARTKSVSPQIEIGNKLLTDSDSHNAKYALSLNESLLSDKLFVNSIALALDSTVNSIEIRKKRKSLEHKKPIPIPNQKAKFHTIGHKSSQDLLEKQNMEFASYTNIELQGKTMEEGVENEILKCCFNRISVLDCSFSGKTMMHYACSRGNKNVISTLINICKENTNFCCLPDLLNLTNLSKENALAEALAMGHINIATELILEGAYFNLVKRITLSKFIENNQCEEILSFFHKLSEHDISEFLKVMKIEHSSYVSETASLLHHLINVRNFKLTKFLISHGLKMNTEAYLISCTLCIIDKRDEDLKLLLDNFASLSLYSEKETPLSLDEFINTDHQNINLLYEAVKVNCYPIVRILLDAGSDPLVYKPRSLETNLLYHSLQYSNTDNGEMFYTFLRYGVGIKLNDAIPIFVGKCHQSCLKMLLILATIKINIQSVIFRQRTSFREPQHQDHEMQPYQGCIDWSDYNFDELSLEWLAATAKIVESLEEFIAEYRMHKSTTIPRAKDIEMHKFLIERIQSNNLLYGVPVEYLNKCSISKVKLSSNKLNIIPIALMSLPNLKELNLSANEITVIPECGGTRIMEESESLILSKYDCKLLEKFDISHNKLKTLPGDLFLLLHLAEVDAADNEIDQLPEEIWTAESLHTIKFRNNKLSQLFYVNESGHETCDRSSIYHLTSTRIRQRMKSFPSYGENHFREIPFNYIDKRKFYLDSVSSTEDTIRSLEASVGVDEKMGKVNREQRDIDDWGNYSSLRVIDLAFNQFSKFPREISCLAPNLQRIDMRGNNIGKLNIRRDIAKSAQIINFDNNQITTINEQYNPLRCYSPCCTMNVLACRKSSKGENQYEWCSHRQNDCFSFLLSISMKGNKLTEFPVVDALRNENQDSAQEIPIKRKINDCFYPQLATLNLESNDLHVLPEELSLITTLNTLNIAHNTRIKHIPLSFQSLKKLYTINLDGLELIGIPPAVRTSASEFIQHLVRTSKETEPNRSFRLILMGDSGKGKTTLLQALTKGAFTPYGPDLASRSTKVTNKIDINKETNEGLNAGIWQYRPRRNESPIVFSCWDFSGKEKYFPIHQAFICDRALFIIVWDINDLENGIRSMWKWLESIEKNAPGSHCIIVGTHLDTISVVKRKLIIYELQKAISARYSSSKLLPNLQDVLLLSYKYSDQINDLREIIYKKVFNITIRVRKGSVPLPLINQPLLVNFTKLSQCITYIKDCTEVKRNIRILTRQELWKLIDSTLKKEQYKLEEEEFYGLSKLLHKNRVLINFEDDPELMEYYVINIEWLCNKFIDVINFNSEENGAYGVVHQDCITRYLEKIDVRQRDIPIFLTFMKKFEIIVELPQSYLLFPSVITKKPKEAIEICYRLKHEAFLDDSAEIPIDHISVHSPTPETSNIQSTIVSTVHWKAVTMPKFTICPPGNKREEIDQPLNGSERNTYLTKLTRLYLINRLPIEFWPQVLSRVLSDQLYLSTLRKSFNVFSKTLSSEQCSTLFKELDNNIIWRVWDCGISLCIKGIEILMISEMFLPPLRLKNIYLISNEYEHERPQLSSVHSGIQVTVTQWKDTLSDLSLKNNDSFNNVYHECSSDDPSIFRQMATSLLQRSVNHLESVIDQWHENIRFSPRSTARTNQSLNIKGYIPCPECYYQLFSISNIGYTLFDMDGLQELKGQGETPNLQVKPCDQVNSSISTDLYLYSVGYLYNVFQKNMKLFCPSHDIVNAKCLIPDVLFHDLPGNMIYDYNNFEIGKKIGAGGYGSVYKVKNKINTSHEEKEIALKVFNLPEDMITSPDNEDEKNWLIYRACSAEARVLIQLSHPNVLEVIGLTQSPPCVLMEIAPQGDLNRIMNLYQDAKAYISSYCIILTLRQISSALAYLHSLRFIYLDLKPNNLLVFEFPNPLLQKDSCTDRVLIKMADYGICSYLPPTGISGQIGTERYMAPEIIKEAGQHRYDNSVDVYSFGLVMYCMITLETPFPNEQPPSIKSKVIAGFRPEVKATAKPRAIYIYDLMRWCWTKNPKERPKSNQIKAITSKAAFQQLLFAYNVLYKKRVPTCAYLVRDSSPNPLLLVNPPALALNKYGNNKYYSMDATAMAINVPHHEIMDKSKYRARTPINDNQIVNVINEFDTITEMNEKSPSHDKENDNTPNNNNNNTDNTLTLNNNNDENSRLNSRYWSDRSNDVSEIPEIRVPSEEQMTSYKDNSISMQGIRWKRWQDESSTGTNSIAASSENSLRIDEGIDESASKRSKEKQQSPCMLDICKPVVKDAFTNCEVWFGTDKGSIHFFEVSDTEFRVTEIMKIKNAQIKCMTKAGSYIWVGTNNSGIVILSAKTHKKIAKWEINRSIKEEDKNVLAILYLDVFDMLFAATASGMLIVFLGASNPIENKVPSFTYKLQNPAVCLKAFDPPNDYIHIWCGCENYKITRFECEDGYKPIRKVPKDLEFYGKQGTQRSTVDNIQSFREKDIAICSVYYELGVYKLTSGEWVRNVDLKEMLKMKEYSCRITALEAYGGILFVGTGGGSIVSLDPETMTMIGHLDEYRDPIRILIPMETTSSNLQKLLGTPKGPARPYMFRKGSTNPYKDAPGNTNQTHLLSLSTNFKGVTENYTNTPQTLEEVVHWKNCRNYKPSKPCKSDSYLVMWCIKNWIKTI